MGMTSNEASRSRPAPSADDHLVLRFPAHPEEIGPARHAVDEYLRARSVPGEIIEDLRLVTSELVTNGVVHGRPGWICVEVDLQRQIIRLRVTNDGPTAKIPPVSEWRPAPGLALSGRGLGIVRQLVDEVEVVGDQTAATVECSRAWSAGAAA